MRTKKPEPPHIKCELCKENFADADTFDAHKRTELDRHQPSNRFLSMPKLAICYSDEALWAQGWRSTKHTKTLWIWTKPPMPKQRAHRISEDAYVCLFCQKAFACSTGFRSHFIMTFTTEERCLDKDELGALAFERGANGVYRINITTQYLPSQIARLPTVRQEMAALEAYERTMRELGEAITPATPYNMKLDPNDAPPGADFVYVEPPVKATLPSPAESKSIFTGLAADLIDAARTS